MSKIKIEVGGLEDNRIEGSAVLPIFTEPVSSIFDEKKLPEGELPIIAARDHILFPGMTLPLILPNT